MRVFLATKQRVWSRTEPEEVIETFAQSVRNMRLKHKALLT